MSIRKRLMTKFTTKDFYLSYGGEVASLLEIKSTDDEEGPQYHVSIVLYNEEQPSHHVSIPMEEVDEVIGLLQEVEKILSDLMIAEEVK